MSLHILYLVRLMMWGVCVCVWGGGVLWDCCLGKDSNFCWQCRLWSCLSLSPPPPPTPSLSPSPLLPLSPPLLLLSPPSLFLPPPPPLSPSLSLSLFNVSLLLMLYLSIFLYHNIFVMNVLVISSTVATAGMWFSLCANIFTVQK